MLTSNPQLDYRKIASIYGKSTARLMYGHGMCQQPVSSVFLHPPLPPTDNTPEATYDSIEGRFRIIEKVLNYSRKND